MIKFIFDLQKSSLPAGQHVYYYSLTSIVDPKIKKIKILGILSGFSKNKIEEKLLKILNTRNRANLTTFYSLTIIKF